MMTAGAAALTSASQDSSKKRQGGTQGSSYWKIRFPPSDLCDVPIFPLTAHGPLAAREAGTCYLQVAAVPNTQEEGQDRCGVSSCLTLHHVLCWMRLPSWELQGPFHLASGSLRLVPWP